MKRFTAKLLCLLFPSRCICCKAVLAYRPSRAQSSHFGTEAPVCAECVPALEAAMHVCRLCGKEPGDCSCFEIKGIRHRFIPFWYSDGAKRAVLNLKRSDCLEHYEFFAALIADRINASALKDSFDCVTYAPRRPSAVRKYGVDQAKRLAESVAKRLGVRCKTLLYRTRPARMQKKLAVEGRLANAADLYLPSPEAAKYENVLLIDDVVTSGATVTACASQLKVLGVRRVAVAAVARAQTREQLAAELMFRASQKNAINGKTASATNNNNRHRTTP